MAFQGIDVRATTDRLLFRTLLLDSAGAKVTAGTTNLRLYELQTDGTLKSYDFSDNTFKTTVLTTPTLAMTHRTGDNSTFNTGVWTVNLITLTGFTVGSIYLAGVTNAGASPPDQVREFQFGSAEGDLVVNAARLNVDVTAISTSTTAADRLEAALAVATGIDINMGQTVPDPGTADTTGRALRSVTGAADLSILTTGFSAGSPNNLNSYLKAIMTKGAAVPTGLGTYDPATDSLEADRELKDLIAGAGFATSTDSLQAIRDAIDILVAPAIVTSTSVSGSGFISDCIGLVRRAVDEPSTTPKYTNADILEFIHAAFDVVLADININTDHAILVRHDISVVSGTQLYALPPTVAQVWRVAKVNSTTGLVEWEVWPGNEFSGHGGGFSIEGNMLRLLSDWKTSETLQILYMPNSDVAFHKGTASAVTATSITFATTPTDGSLDVRKNAYAGYLVRILSATTGAGEERLVTAYVNSTGVATINTAWDVTPTGTIVYEVIPQFSRLLKHIVCLRAAIDVLAQEGNQKRMQTLTAAYQVKMSALRRYQSSQNARFPHSATGDTMDNPNRGGWSELGLL
jgi:hypothetical protein